MSLPNLEWRYVGRQYIGTGTIYPNTILDNVYTLASSSYYDDGSSRVQGSGSAGTWSRYQNGSITEAIYMTPPSGNQSIIVAGISGTTPTPSPTMSSVGGSSLTWSANRIFVGMVKNPGNFNSWNAANPFSSGNNFGYVPFHGDGNSATGGIISYGSNSLYAYLFESKESIVLFLIINAISNPVYNSSTTGFIAGAIIDPLSSNLNDAESDGRLYGILSTGHCSSTNAGSSWSSTTPNFALDWHNHSNMTSMFLYSSPAVSLGAKGGIFIPSSSNIRDITITHSPSNVVGTKITSSLITNSNQYIRFPIFMKSLSDNVCFGQLRNIKYCNPGLIGQLHTNGVNTIGHLLCCSNNPSIIADAVLLEY